MKVGQLGIWLGMLRSVLVRPSLLMQPPCRQKREFRVLARPAGGVGMRPGDDPIRVNADRCRDEFGLGL